MTSAVDLDFRPEVAAFDANAALGRRHDRRVAVDDAAGLLAEMDRAGVERALVYAPHAAAFDSAEGNAGLLEAIGDESRLVPQFVCNPTFDDLEATKAQIEAAGVRAVRMVPTLHHYPFRSWVVGEWLEWLSSRGIPLWLPASYEANWHDGDDLDPHAVHETAREFPDLTRGAVRGALCASLVGTAAAAEPVEPVNRGFEVRDRGRDCAAAGARGAGAGAVRVAVSGAGHRAAAVSPAPVGAERGRFAGSLRGQP